MQIRSINDVAAAVKGRRLALGLTQADLATRCGVSRKWVYEFEGGKGTAELALLLRVLAAMDARVEITTAKSASADGIDLDVHLARYLKR